MALSRDREFWQGMPVAVEWGSFRSDTYSLGQCGWEVAMNQDMMRGNVEMVLCHRQFGIWGRGRVSGLYAMNMQRHQDFRPPTFRIQAAGSLDGRVQMVEQIDFKSFSIVDTVPEIRVVNEQFQRLPYFAELFSPRAEVQQLIVDPNDVQDMLNRIMQLQGPMRKEIRAREAKRERDEPQTKQVYAQIISLRQAA